MEKLRTGQSNEFCERVKRHVHRRHRCPKFRKRSSHEYAGAFEFTLTGPPGAYVVQGSTDLVAWTDLGTTTNNLGGIAFTDAEARFSRLKFYRPRSP